jgi:hypothetical protein
LTLVLKDLADEGMGQKNLPRKERAGIYDLNNLLSISYGRNDPETASSRQKQSWRMLQDAL